MNKYGEIENNILHLKYILPKLPVLRYRFFEKMETYFASFGYDVQVNPFNDRMYRLVKSAQADLDDTLQSFLEGTR